ncbi:hypothetical protein [Comamonas koreensis]|uniref:Uncharacterized protein n=1 Tax=Comamonas koreensis TaxID=160825 RepID=A0AAW4Y3K3_9BURK|nr:hypothetical protein [Comamonas koreensis]MCD2168058.1 hypothetical protein [Comamonas koreensis]
MIPVKSTVPLYVGGKVVTEFETSEAHFRELVRVHGDVKVKQASAKAETKPDAKKASKQ